MFKHIAMVYTHTIPTDDTSQSNVFIANSMSDNQDNGVLFYQNPVETYEVKTKMFPRGRMQSEFLRCNSYSLLVHNFYKTIFS